MLHCINTGVTFHCRDNVSVNLPAIHIGFRDGCFSHWFSGSPDFDTAS
jgi:hypothetical protein